MRSIIDFVVARAATRIQRADLITNTACVLVFCLLPWLL